MFCCATNTLRRCRFNPVAAASASGGIVGFQHGSQNHRITNSTCAFSSTTDNPSTTTASSTTATDLNQSLFKNPIVQRLWSARQQAKHQQKQQNKQKPREDGDKKSNTNYSSSPSNSRVEVSYPFSSDALLWEAYRNPWGQIRFGRLLEDLDALAGNIAFFHVENSTSNGPADGADQEFPVIVTASVDRIRLRRRPRIGCDQLLYGQVTWTGRSSMEIKMCCSEQQSSVANPHNNNDDDHWLEAYVTFVTLDPKTRRPMAIPPIVPQTDEEKREFENGAQRAAFKKLLRQRVPTEDNSANDDQTHILARELLDSASPLINLPSLADPRDILMERTSMQNAIVAMPQVQNLHGGIFGGFLMRRAYELAFSTAYCFAGARPIFLEVDQVSFTLPVNVGDLLIFHSNVLYTGEGHVQTYYEPHHSTYTSGLQSDPSFVAQTQHSMLPPKSDTTQPDSQGDLLPLVHVEVEAWVTVPEQAKSQVSNQFYFTFAVEPLLTGHGVQQKVAVRRVLPSNIDQARRMATRIRINQEKDKLVDAQQVSS